MERKVIKAAELVKFLEENAKTNIFSLTHKRVNPKCRGCGYSNAKLQGMSYCPKCGGGITELATHAAKIHVSNPQHVTKPGQGKFIGESFEQRLERGRMTYFAMNAVAKIEKDGTETKVLKGNYRQCYVDMVKKVVVNGVEYMVEQ